MPNPSPGYWTVHFRTDWRPRRPARRSTNRKMKAIAHMWHEVDANASWGKIKTMRRKLRTLCDFIVEHVLRAGDTDTLEWLGHMCAAREDYLPLDGASVILQDERDVAVLAWCVEHVYCEEDRPMMRELLVREYGMVAA